MPKKVLKGTIKSVSGTQTVKVEVVRTFHHPRYKKRVKVNKSYLAHLATGEPQVGQLAVIEETRPISRSKRFLVIELNGEKIAKLEAVKEEKPAAKKVRSTLAKKKPAGGNKKK